MDIWMRVIFVLALLLPLAQVRSQQAAGTVDYATQIQPILTKNCQSCHRGGAAPASLRLDSAAGLVEGSISGKVIIAGKSGESLLMQRITDGSGLRMPLNGSPLTSEEIARIRTWIDQGARIPDTLLTAAKAAAPSTGLTSSRCGRRFRW